MSDEHEVEACQGLQEIFPDGLEAWRSEERVILALKRLGLLDTPDVRLVLSTNVSNLVRTELKASSGAASPEAVTQRALVWKDDDETAILAVQGNVVGYRTIPGQVVASGTGAASLSAAIETLTDDGPLSVLERSGQLPPGPGLWLWEGTGSIGDETGPVVTGSWRRPTLLEQSRVSMGKPVW